VLKWIARGCVFPPAGVQLPSWIGGYAAAPYAVATNGALIRVFFSGRDERNRGQIGACDLDVESWVVDPVGVTREPLVGVGPLGAFDESGCSMSCIVRQGSRWFLYYTGWMLGRTVPFYLSVGLAVSEDDGRTFHKYSPAPIMDRCTVDPFLTASPCVIVDGGIWRMWYVSAMEWETKSDKPRHRYLIKYAESRDGVQWRRDGRIAIDFEGDDEYAMGRPHVVKDGEMYRMWYCIRGEQYRIAYAQSSDGLVWTRCDAANEPPPRQAWDSEMQAYPMVFRHRDRWLMLYNGNRYGATGFGCAESPS